MRRFCGLLTFALATSAGVSAQVVTVPVKPVVGSSNPATPVPAVARPSTKPCVVTLLHEQAYENYTPAPLSYTPPAACPGPWAKVVLNADFTVSKGVQYDRTAYFFLGGSNIFYGTTAEPSSNLSPSWHVERDVTDLSAVFEKPQTGAAFAGNIVNSTYTGVIYANAKLEFYPATLAEPAPRVADVVVPVNNGNNSPVTLNTGTDQATATLQLPRNTEKVYLDVISQAQIGDEFFYFCVPNDVATELESCGNTAFRETEITIDGKPAGVAPVYPWIFTGGIDPYLWRPIVGVQTLDFKPYRVDLTPFAGLLNDGNTHTLAISVYNANGYFLETANLLAFADHGKKVLEGGLLSDSLAAEPTPQVDENLKTTAKGVVKGTVAVSSNRKYSISGYVETSHGRVETTVADTVKFDNLQTFKVSATEDLQNVVQTSTSEQTTTTTAGVNTRTETRHTSFPLTIDFLYAVNTDGSSAQTTTAQQGYTVTHAGDVLDVPVSSANQQEKVVSTDKLSISAAGALTGATGESSASFMRSNGDGGCFSRVIESSQRVLTSVKDGTGCPVE